MVLCGNKLDLEVNERVVSTQEAFDLAEKEEMLFFEISAKDDININRMFYTSISCLDCFDDVREDYKNLAYDIEYENNLNNTSNIDYNTGSSSNAPPTPSIKVRDEQGKEHSVKMTNSENDKKRKCKC